MTPKTPRDIRRMNFFWGNDRMSWLRYMTIYSFCKLNPDWSVTLHRCPDRGITNKYWVEKNCQDFHSYDGPDYSGETEKLNLDVVEWTPPVNRPELGPSHLSNLFKWGLMATDGGWYADLDILWVRPMAHYLDTVEFSEDMAICYRRGYFSIGLLASRGNIGLFRHVLNVANNATSECYQSAGVTALYTAMSCPVHVDGTPVEGNCLSKIRGMNPGLTIHNFPMRLVYPWDSLNVPELFLARHTDLPERTIGLHWYAGHPLAQQVNRALNPKTVKTMETTIAHFARQVLEC